jgi:RecA-family ATPase
MHNPALPDLQGIARALGGVISNGQVRAPGPGHSSTDRSLSVKIEPGAPGGILVHSFANDDPVKCRDFVAQRCGLPAFKSNGNGYVRRTDAEIERALVTAITRQPADHKLNITKTYDYTDESGTLLYQVCRLEPKSFRQRRPVKGGWIYKLDDVRRVLYRLPDLLKYPDASAFITEGEKDCDRVAALDLCATTVASGRWKDVDLSPLKGRDCIILEDADEPGRKKALLAAHVLHGTAATIRVVRLPELTGHPSNKDVSDWLSVDARRAERLVDVCFDTPVWEPGADHEGDHHHRDHDGDHHGEEDHHYGGDQHADAGAEPGPVGEVKAAPKAEAEPPLAFLNLAAWSDAPVPERQWVVRDRIPLNNVTLLSGEGAVGKSILSLHLAVATVLARDWAGTMPEPGAAMVIACEDDGGELHHRLHHIAAHFGASFADLAGLHVTSLAGQDALMATPRRDGLLQTTKLFGRVLEAACDIKPKLIVLDNSADIFGGGENDRAQVRQFIGILRGLAMAANAGVLLTSHPSLTGITTGTGLSGSTAWNASVRSRLYFKRATTAKDEEPDPDMRILEVMKANYGPVGETVTLRWKNGLFLPVAGMSSLDRMAREQKVDDLFLNLLDRSTGQGRNVSDKKTANSYAPSRFATEPETKAEHITKKELVDAMERLFRAGKIHVSAYGLPSKGWTRIERR